MGFITLCCLKCVTLYPLLKIGTSAHQQCPSASLFPLASAQELGTRVSTAAHACSWNKQVEVARASCEGARCPLSVPSPACALSTFLCIDLFWMKNHSRKQLFFLTPVPHLLPQTVVLCFPAAGQGAAGYIN